MINFLRNLFKRKPKQITINIQNLVGNMNITTETPNKDIVEKIQKALIEAVNSVNENHNNHN